MSNPVEGASVKLIDDKEHAKTFFAAVKWDVLAFLASERRDGIPCRLDAEFSTDDCNMFRNIIFKDEITWVARLSLPALGPAVKDALTLDREAFDLKVQIDGMKFIKTETSIPIAEIHLYDTDPTNNVGAPYILMDFIDGTIATEWRDLQYCNIGLYGTPDQDRNFRKQMANIQAELASHRFGMIGTLYKDEKTSEYGILRDKETGKGPWLDSHDYFKRLAYHAVKECEANGRPQLEHAKPYGLPDLFKDVMLKLTPYGRTGPFSLTIRDFGAHNILVNENFKIVGVTNFNYVIASSMEVVAQYPQFMGLDLDPPREDLRMNPLTIERIKKANPKLEEYRSLVEEAEYKFESRSPQFSPFSSEALIAYMMLSDGTHLYKGLRAYMKWEEPTSKMWLDYYMKLGQDILFDGFSTHDPPSD